MSPKSIDAYMIGEHGFSQLAAFKAATIAGKSLNELQAENPDKYAFDHMEVEELARKGGYVTHIRHAYDGAEVFFPDLSKDDRWELAETIAHAEDQDKALDFCYYRNLSPQPLEAML